MPKQRRKKPKEDTRLEDAIKGALLLTAGIGLIYGIKVLIALLAVVVVIAFAFLWVRKRSRSATKKIDGQRPANSPSYAWALSEPSERQTSFVVLPQTTPLPAERTEALTWNLELLRRLDWKRFEELLEHFWKAKGFKAEATGRGSDGGVDVRLYQPSAPEKVLGIIQCKARSGKPVGVDKVRELFGVMSHEKVALGVLATTFGFTPDALAFAKGKSIQLIDGKKLLEQIATLPDEKQQALLAHITRGDYETPTCASCDVKMVVKNNKATAGRFYGCPNFPRCRNLINSAKLNLPKM